MLNLMTKHISIIIIILLTIKIIFSKAQPAAAPATATANKRAIDNAEHYGNFTAIEFLKELEHFQPTFDNILIMQNQNATISNIFHTHLIKVLHENYNNASAGAGALLLSHQRRFAIAASETAATRFVNRLMDRLQVPVLQLNELQSFYLKRHYSEHLLSIVYIDINNEGIQMTFNDHKGLLEKLSANLLHMRTSEVMFLLNFPMANRGDGITPAIDKDVIRGVLVEIFYYCWQQKIINVVALLADYQTSRTFYSYTHFPSFQVEAKKISFHTTTKQEEIFPNRLRDLMGHKLSVVITGADPRIIPYTTSKGQEIIGGFVGHFIRVFGKRYNCTLVQPLPFDPNNLLPSKVLSHAVRDGIAELSVGMLNPGATLTGFSYPIQILNWCIMLPVEANIPAYKFYFFVFKGNTFLLVMLTVLVTSMLLTAALYLQGHQTRFCDIICRDDCLRGVLGQAFPEIRQPSRTIKFIYIKLCIFGILLTTSYSSHFSTYVTHAPKEPLLQSYDDIMASGLKIVVWESEYISMGVSTNYKKYAPIFHLVEDYHQFLQLRDSFNTKYGYVVPATKWNTIKQQQKIFTTPLFRMSNKLCLVNSIPLSFPVNDNSLYVSLINQLILETSQSGLLYQWLSYSFLELVMAKKLKLVDLSTKEEFNAMSVDDLRYVLIYLFCLHLLASFVFVAEHLLAYCKRIKRRT